jgi:site-specific recombinase XerD
MHHTVDCENISSYYGRTINHDFVSYLLNQGESIYNVSKIVGHSATQITEFIYAHHVADNLVRSMDKMKQLTETSENEIF